MNIPTTLPDHLDETQRYMIRDLFSELEILPISCLLYEADEYRVIHQNRRIPDDFIYIPKRNRLVCTVGDERCEIGPGEFMMVSAGETHGVVMAEGTDNYEVFALHMHALDGSGHRVFSRLNSPFGSLQHCDVWFEKLAICTHLMGRSDATATTYFKQLVTWLLHEQVLQGTRLIELPKKIDDRIALLLYNIRAHCANDWTVTRMAKQCHLSVSRFRELFTESTGVSPKKYVQKVRLSHARSLLATEPALTVEEVADHVGINDAHYFHAIYKDMFGETPKQRGPGSGSGEG